MSKLKIDFNGVEYYIEESAFASAKAELETHLSTTMNGSGSVIKLGDSFYNVDSTKLATATNDFVSHLGTISGSGEKIVVNGVEYAINSTKITSAISELENTLSKLESVTDNYVKGAVKYYSLAREKIYINTSLSKEEVVNILANSDIYYTATSAGGAWSACYFVYGVTDPENEHRQDYNSLYLHNVYGNNEEYRIAFYSCNPNAPRGEMDLYGYYGEIFNSNDGWVNTDVFLNEDGSIKDEFLTGIPMSNTSMGVYNDAHVYTENHKLTDLIYVKKPITHNSPVPREGYIGEVQFNINMSVEEVCDILSKLEYDEISTAYVYYSSDTSGVLVGSSNGVYFIGSLSDLSSMLFDSSNGGWNPNFNGVIEVNAEVQPIGLNLTDGTHTKEYGLQNDLLVDLIYIEVEGESGGESEPSGYTATFQAISMYSDYGYYSVDGGNTWTQVTSDAVTVENVTEVMLKITAHEYAMPADWNWGSGGLNGSSANNEVISETITLTQDTTFEYVCYD